MILYRSSETSTFYRSFFSPSNIIALDFDYTVLYCMETWFLSANNLLLTLPVFVNMYALLIGNTSLLCNTLISMNY